MRLVILDRDGVINRDSPDHITDPDKWLPLPGSIDAVARLCRADYRVVIATNQSGVARGLFDMSMLNKIHIRMLELMHHRGARVDAIFVCPHGPRDRCSCRKPKPGLLEDIASRLNINLTAVPAVGDSLRDLQAAQAVSAMPVLVRTGNGERTAADLRTRPSLQKLASVPVFDDLSAFADALLAGELDGVVDELRHGTAGSSG